MIEKKRADQELLSSFSIRRFVLLYLLYMAGMALLLTKPISGWMDLDRKFSIGEAFTSAKILNWIGIQCRAEEKVLHLQNTSLSIEFGCNGLEATMILMAGVLAFPAAWKRKAAGLLAGSILLQLFNWMRITLLAASSVYYPKAFEILHVYVAQAIMIVLALVFFLLYVMKAPNPDVP